MDWSNARSPSGAAIDARKRVCRGMRERSCDELSTSVGGCVMHSRRMPARPPHHAPPDVSLNQLRTSHQLQQVSSMHHPPSQVSDPSTSPTNHHQVSLSSSPAMSEPSHNGGIRSTVNEKAANAYSFAQHSLDRVVPPSSRHRAYNTASEYASARPYLFVSSIPQKSEGIQG